MYFDRLFDCLAFQQERYPQKVALSYAGSNGWIHHSIDEIIHLSNQLSVGLSEKGVKKGDNVCIISNYSNSWWIIVDVAIQQIGATVVPIHATATDEQIVYILKETDAAFCFVSNTELQERLSQLKEDCPNFKEILFLKKSTIQNLTLHSSPEKIAALEDFKKTIKGSDLATIIYTSGTTGEPKGVMLSHQNIVSNILSVITLLPVKPGDKAISFLPLSHIFERMVSYAYFTMGIQIHYVKANELRERMKEVKPDFMTCVPRLLEKMYEGVIQKVNGWYKIFRYFGWWAIRLGERYPIHGRLSMIYSIQLFFVRILFFNKIKKITGGNLDAVVVGAAALQPRLGRLFSAIGIKVREGYGLTETSPIVSFNRFEAGGVNFGTVGIPLANLEVKIDQPDEEGQGEIMVKGPNVMMGYYKKPEITNEVIENEWFRTGDIGKFVFKRFLQITDRKKDIFKTSVGKYVAPQKLEKELKTIPFVGQCMVWGENKPYPIAIIIPAFEELKNWCLNHNVHWTAPLYMVVNPKVEKLFENEIEKMNQDLEKHERIRKFILVAHEWTVENNELTPTLKPRRSILYQKYKAEIEKIYPK